MVTRYILIGILSLLLVISWVVCFMLGKKYYLKKIMPYKIAEYTFDLLLRISDSARQEVLDFVGHIGANKQEILDEVHRVENIKNNIDKEKTQND